jgi:hypothetical protein
MFAIIPGRDHYDSEAEFHGALEDQGYEVRTRAMWRVPPNSMIVATRSRIHPIHHDARRRTHEQSSRTGDSVRCYRSQSDARHAQRRWPPLVRADLDGDRHVCPARCERLSIFEPIDPGTLRRTPRAVTLTGPFLKHVQAPVAAQELSTRSYLVVTAPPWTTGELGGCPAVNGYVKSFSPVNMAFGQTIRYGPNSCGDAPGYGEYGLRPKERCANAQR